MKILSRLAAIVLLMIAGTAAAAPFSVKGTVTDSLGDGEAFATYRIFALPDTGKAVAISTTDENGAFSRTLPKAGKYRLVVNSVGKQTLDVPFSVSSSQPEADLGTMVMNISGAMLREVTVTAQRPLVVKEIDRIGYDVQADEDSKTSTIIEMLRKVPMVSVEADGTITVNGSSDFKIFKNGRPNKSFSSNPKDVLSAIPASMIKKIEVITEPGAKYDAEGIGAILNIVTLENTTVRGVMGSVNLSSRSTTDMIPSNGSLWLQSQIDKVTFSVNGGSGFSRKNDRKFSSESESEYSNGNTTTSSSTGTSANHYGWFGGEASYEPDTLNLFTADFNGFFYGGKSWNRGNTAMYDPAGELMYKYNSSTYSPGNNNFNMDGSVNYQRSTSRKGEALTLNYMLSISNGKNHSESEYEDSYNMPVPYDRQSFRSKERLFEHTFQADWTRPFAEIHTFETGAKYIIRRNHANNYQTFGDNPEEATEFKHITDVGALYAQYSVRLGKLSMRAGLRYEFSRLKAEYFDEDTPGFSSHLNDLVPSAAVSWQISDAQSLAFNFASRINRPSIGTLNPVHNSTPTTDSYGNPDLSSARHNSFKLTYMYIRPKFNVNFSANYDMSNSGISGVTFVDENNIINNTYANVGRHRQISFSTFFQWSITPKTRWMFNGRDGTATSREATPSTAGTGISSRSYRRIFPQSSPSKE